MSSHPAINTMINAMRTMSSMFQPTVRTSVRTAMTTAALACAALAFAPAVLSAQNTSLSLGASFDPADMFTAGPFGKGVDATVAVGQTFRAPNDAVCAVSCYLNSFSFFLSNDEGFTANAADVSFRGYIAEWNGTTATNLLFTSNVFSGPAALSQQFTFAVPGLAVVGTKQYVAFLSAVGLSGSIVPLSATAAVETVLGGQYSYADGGFVFTNSGSTLEDLSGTDWDYTGDPEWQTRYSASFSSSVVPEPSSLVLLATGAAGLLLIARKRRV